MPTSNNLASILLVDDDKSSLLIYDDILAQEGFEILKAENGRQALSILQKRPVDLLITDLFMPEMDGFDLIRTAKAIYPEQFDLLVIVVTGSDDVQAAIATLDLGVFGYIIKPPNPNDLNALVKRALEKQKLLRNKIVTREAEQRKNLMDHIGRLAILGEMASGIAHEIKQPLSVINLVVQSWKLFEKREMLTIAKVSQEIGSVLSNVQRINRIVDQIRSVSRHQQKISTINLNDTIRNILSFCQIQLKNHGVELRQELRHNPMVDIAASEFEQVLLNLVINARYAVEERSQAEDIKPFIAVRSGKRGNMVFVEVEDNGGGIASKDAEAIFESYFTTKPPGCGTGIGLSISRQIIERYGGDLLLKSNVGQGAIFQIRLAVSPKRPSSKKCKRLSS